MTENKKRNPVKMKQFTVTQNEIDIIDNNLYCYGDLSGFIRYCLNRQDLIDKYKNN